MQKNQRKDSWQEQLGALEGWPCLQARRGCRQVVIVPLSTSGLEVHRSRSDVLSNRRLLTICELCALCRVDGPLGRYQGCGWEKLWGLVAYVRPGSQIVRPWCKYVDYECDARQSGGSATYVELLDSVSAVGQRTSPTRLILASRAGHGYSTLVKSTPPPQSRAMCCCTTSSMPAVQLSGIFIPFFNSSLQVVTTRYPPMG